MQSQIHFDANDSALSTIKSWLSPTGGAFVDGVRLAVINGMFLLGALMLAVVIALIGRLLRIFIPIPVASPGLIVLVLSILFGLVVWYRYASSHYRLAQASGKTVHPDRFGVIAGSPFALLAIMLLGSGLFGLAFSIAGLNVGGISNALGRLIFAVLFGILAAGCVVIARMAMRE